MPKQPTDSAKDVWGDSATFVEFMRKLIAVPHSEIKAELDAEKEMKRTSKNAASRASGVPSSRT